MYELVCNIYLVTQFFEGRTVNAEYDSDYSFDIESMPIYFMKKLLMTAGFIISFLIISLIILLILFMLTICAISLDNRNQGRRRSSSARVNNQNILRTIKHFPFGNILFQEGGTECCICLMDFKPEEKVV